MWNRFDICEAWFVFASSYHGGQRKKEYEIFGRLHRMRFRPRPSLSRRADLTENGKAIYDQLVRRSAK